MGLHFFFINFLSQGILLFNFGFALSSKKRVMNTDRKNTKNLVKRSRRETYMRIAVGSGLSDDEEDDDIDDDETYYTGFRISTGGQEQRPSAAPHNPFKMGARLRHHLEADHSPNGGGGGLDKTFDLDDDDNEEAGNGMFSIFRKITQKRQNSFNKQRKYTAIVSKFKVMYIE